jgi:hypothetical protein
MTIDILPSFTAGWAAVAAGIAGWLAFAFIILFFTVGQPFGTLNDIFIGLAAILSVVLALKLFPGHYAQSPLISQAGLGFAILGAILVLVGSTLAITGLKGWFLSGLYMAVGNAMIGLWLLGLNYSGQRDHSLPGGLIIFGLISAVILALGLVAIPGIFRGIDFQEYETTVVNLIWWTGSLGYLTLYPLWCIWLGRLFLSNGAR